MQLDIFDTANIVHLKENNSGSQKILDIRPKLNKQCLRVFEVLMRGEVLTTRSAMIDHHIGHLPRRIKDLRDRFFIHIMDEEKEDGFKIWYMTQEQINLNRIKK